MTNVNKHQEKVAAERAQDDAEHVLGQPLPEEDDLMFYDRQTYPVERYTIVGDDSGHQFCIPLNRRKEWFEWLEAPEGSVRDDAPPYAMRIEGTFSFTDPQITY